MTRIKRGSVAKRNFEKNPTQKSSKTGATRSRGGGGARPGSRHSGCRALRGWGQRTGHSPPRGGGGRFPRGPVGVPLMTHGGPDPPGSRTTRSVVPSSFVPHGVGLGGSRADAWGRMLRHCHATLSHTPQRPVSYNTALRHPDKAGGARDSSRSGMNSNVVVHRRWWAKKRKEQEGQEDCTSTVTSLVVVVVMINDHFVKLSALVVAVI